MREDLEKGHALGGQIYVALEGAPRIDAAFGEARPGEPMRRSHLMLWLSSTKPVTVVALARLWERGRVDLDDRVADHLPEFGTGGKQEITVRHLLTHTAGIRSLDVGWPQRSWEEIVEGICDMRLEPRWRPGHKAGYHLTSSWFVLGEIVRRLTGLPFSEAIRREVFEPLGLADSWIGMPPERYTAYGRRIAPMFDTTVSPPRSLGWEAEPRVTKPSPGSNGWGPVRDLGRLYEALLARGRTPDGTALLSPQTVEALTARHRVGLFDHTFRSSLDWGLGFVLDSKRQGDEIPPYGYGPHASRRTFGHSGYRSSMAFADPERRLVVALAVNGLPSDAAHRERFHRLAGALYEDLGLA